MSTPQPSVPQLAKAIGIPNLFLKREDLHPFGSHKGRSIPMMIETYAKKGVTNFVISSSGNAALAAIHAVKKYNQEHSDATITLHIFVGRHIDEEKLKNIQYQIFPPKADPCLPDRQAPLADNIQNIRITQTDRPKQSAFQEAKKPNTIFLRQSTDDVALLGYAELAAELAEIPNLSAVFIPTSSGTTAQALGEWFLEYKKQLEIHIVQTTSCHPIADQILLKNTKISDVSIATAIVDNIAHRKEKVAAVISQTRGNAWIATNEDIQFAMALVKKETDIDISPNSALSVAGLIRAVQTGWQPKGSVACLITGA